MDIYNVIFYILIFVIGTLFGSFYTLAVYRIPKKQDIIHTHSYCPNCNHKLGVLDLIPVFSYIFLGGKCRYCKQKIRPRYFVIETLSGFTFVTLAYLMKFDIYTIMDDFTMSGQKIAEYVFMILYITFVVLMAITEKENRKIEKSISVYGIVISIMYIVYLCMVEQASIYRYVIYLIFYILILAMDTMTLKKHAKDSYTNGILLTIVTMSIFTGAEITVSSIIYVLLIIFIYMLLVKLKKKSKKERSKIVDKNMNKTLPIGFYLGVANIVTFLVVMICGNLVI